MFFHLKKLFLFKFNFMKHIINLLLPILLLAGCDDGDLSVTTFNFTSLNLSKCPSNTFLYNASQNEVMLLDIPLTNFINSEGTRIYTLNSEDKLVYRLYNDIVNNLILCADFPVSDPQVVEEWTALSGATIEITTIANTDLQNGGILNISGYTHRIVLKDIIFKKGNNQMIYEEYVFGNYITPNLVKFNFSEAIQSCETNDLLYILNQREALVMNLENEELFLWQDTNGIPRTVHINSITNQIIYKVFDANVAGVYFCSIIPQTWPNLVEEWYAIDGENEEGLIEVETEQVLDEVTGELAGYIHHITLKNVTFSNTNTSFSFDEYYVGRYGVEVE